MARTDHDYADRYAIYLAYDQACAYCLRPLQFADFEIEHIVPQHLADDPVDWQKAIAEYGLPTDFDVEGDGNRMASCGQDNRRKSGDLLPPNYAILLLQTASKKAPLVKKLRTKWISDRKRGRTLADVGKALAQQPSFRDQLMAMIHPEFPPAKPSAANWGDITASARTKQLLGAASNALLGWPQDINGHWFDRSELSELEDATSGHEPRIVALLGPPGSGKSAILARLGTKLRTAGCTLLAIKADFLPAGVGSLQDLDQFLGVPEPLAILIERLAAESPVTILIDQLDALGDLMDTRTERLSALLSLTDRMSLIADVNIIVSCREFDAQHDLRLRNLIQRTGTIRITLADPSWDTIKIFLCEKGFQPANWPECVKHILCRPQQLKLFLTHFTAAGERPAFETYHAMLELILQERVIKPFGVSVLAALDEITTQMATREELWLPRAPLERSYEQGLLQLQHAGLIRVSDDQTKIGFGHQTLFDFLRARSFTAGKRNLFAEVRTRQEGIAIRPELWSTISYLRHADTKRYCSELAALLGSAEIRPHIKILLISFLETVPTPMTEEAAWLRPLLTDTTLRPHILHAIQNNKEWFALMRNAILATSYEGDQAAYQASFVLGPALGFDRGFVLSGLTQWLTTPHLDRATFNTLLNLTEWDERTYHILETVLARTPVDSLWVCKIAQEIATNRPDLAARIIRMKLDQELATAMTSVTPRPPPPAEDAPLEQHIEYQLSSGNTCESLRQLLRHHGEWYGLDAVAKKGPGDFIEHLWTWVERISLLLSDKWSTGTARRYRDDSAWRFGEQFASYLSEALWSAVSNFATAEPDRFLKWASDASSAEALSVHRLIVQGLIAIAAERPTATVEYLLSDQRRFAIGGYYSGRSQTQCLIKAVGPLLDDTDLDRLVRAIGSWEYHDIREPSDPENAKYREWNEQARLDLLAALPRDRLAEGLRVKLSVHPEPVDSPGEVWKVSSGFIESPVPVDWMQRASNSEIVARLQEYPDTRERSGDFRIGGSAEAAQHFGEFAKKDPDRALDIIRQLRPAQNELAAGRGFEALATLDSVDGQEIIALADQLITDGFSSSEFRSGLCWALLRVAERTNGLPEQSITHLQSFLRKPETSQLPADEATPLTASDKERGSILWGQRPTVLPTGNYPPLLAITIGLLRRNPPARDQWLAILEQHLAVPEHPDVWKALLPQLRFLASANQDRAIPFIQALLQQYPALIPTIEGVQFIATCQYWLPQHLFDTLLDQLRASGWASAQQAIGELLVLRVALVPKDTKSNEQLDQALKDTFENPTSLQVGLVHSAAETWTSLRFRETSHRVLMAAIPSAQAELAQTIMGAFSLHEPGSFPADQFTAELLTAVASSSILLVTSNTRLLIDCLKELLQNGYSPCEVGKVARRIVDVAGAAIASIATALSVSAGDLIDIAITLQRFPEARSDGTWIFERLLALNAYSVADTASKHDRRF